MRAITAVFTIELISILMVGCTGCLRTNPFCLRICVCTHVLSHVCVSVGISDILCRFSLGCYYCLAFCLSIWKSVLSGYLSSMATSSIISMGIKMVILSYTPNVEQWVFLCRFFSIEPSQWFPLQRPFYQLSFLQVKTNPVYHLQTNLTASRNFSPKKSSKTYDDVALHFYPRSISPSTL